VHDPWRPAPSVGLHLGTPAAFADRSEVDDRADVLVYTSAPLPYALVLSGVGEIDLFVDADRPSFDLDCTLSVVAPDGAEADALATAAGVLGTERGVALVTRRKGLEARVEELDGGIRVRRETPGFARLPRFFEEVR
jgi:predicted acyl esterase